MPSIHPIQITIRASRAKVWTVLTDFPSWELWNPFIVQAAGVAQVGKRLNLKFNDGMSFQPIVELANGSELQWLGRLFNIPGLFDGRHRFVLREQDGLTTVEQSEDFTGLLAAPLLYFMAEKVRQNFVSLNLALKQRAEADL